jgi:hypothetical protein
MIIAISRIDENGVGPWWYTFGICFVFVLFFLCMHIVGANDGVKLLEDMDKKW